MYGGLHWTVRKSEAERVHYLVLSKTSPNTVRFTSKVAVVVTVYFDKNPLDPDNIPAKLYIDGLKFRIIKDDDPHWVESVKTVSKIDPAYPRVEIEVIPIEN